VNYFHIYHRKFRTASRFEILTSLPGICQCRIHPADKRCGKDSVKSVIFTQINEEDNLYNRVPVFVLCLHKWFFGAKLQTEFMKKEVIMRFMSSVFAVTLAILFLAPFSVMAQEKMSYLAIKAGAFSPAGDFDDAGFESGFNGEIALGRYFDPDAAIEGGIGFYRSAASVSDPSSSVDDSVWVIPITGTIKGILPFKDVNLFGGVGLGIYFANAEVKSKDKITAVSDKFTDDDTVFGFHVSIGVSVNITPDIFLGFEGKRIWTEEAEFSGSLFGSTQTVKSDLDATTLTGNLGFRF